MAPMLLAATTCLLAPPQVTNSDWVVVRSHGACEVRSAGKLERPDTLSIKNVVEQAVAKDEHLKLRIDSQSPPYAILEFLRSAKASSVPVELTWSKAKHAGAIAVRHASEGWIVNGQKFPKWKLALQCVAKLANEYDGLCRAGPEIRLQLGLGSKSARELLEETEIFLELEKLGRVLRVDSHAQMSTPTVVVVRDKRCNIHCDGKVMALSRRALTREIVNFTGFGTHGRPVYIALAENATAGQLLRALELLHELRKQPAIYELNEGVHHSAGEKSEKKP